MRRISIMVCPIRCGAEENLRYPERSEGGGVVLNSQDFAAVSSARNPRAYFLWSWFLHPQPQPSS